MLRVGLNHLDIVRVRTRRPGRPVFNINEYALRACFSLTGLRVALRAPGMTME